MMILMGYNGGGQCGAIGRAHFSLNWPDRRGGRPGSGLPTACNEEPA